MARIPPPAAQLPLTGIPLPAASFVHTDNPRELRIIRALAAGQHTREQLDDIAGSSNGPDAIAALRRKGLAIPCCRELARDRDGNTVFRGRYRFTELDLILTRHLWEAA